MPNRSERRVHRWIVTSLLLVILGLPGCMITQAGRQLESIEPQPPAVKPSVEETVGDFAFTLEGGKMISSYQAGQMLNSGIMKHWQKQGYISSHAHVASGEFSGDSDYNVTLSGSQYGESSVAMQVLSGLTLFLFPYSVDTRYDVQYVAESVKTGERYSAGVQDNYKTTMQLFLIFALPFSQRGLNQTIGTMGDHLYQQLRDKGAFYLPQTSAADADSRETGNTPGPAHP